METNYDLRISKRKLTSIWALALYILSTATYCYLMYKCLMTEVRYEKSQDNLVNKYLENKLNLRFLKPDEIKNIIKVDLENTTIKEREAIIFDHLIHQVYTFISLLSFVTVFYFIFEAKCLESVPSMILTYSFVLIFQEQAIELKFKLLLFTLIGIFLIYIISRQENVEQMVVLFNSNINLLFGSALIIIFAVACTAFFIIFQIYMLRNIHIYVADVNFVVYLCLLLYFLFSVFTSFFFLCSFITSLAFYSMLHNGNLLLVLTHSYLNVFYLSGEICNYGFNYYKNVIMSDFLFFMSIYLSPLISRFIKCVMTFILLTSWFVSPFFRLLSIDGYHVICFITLTGQSLNSSYRRVNQMVNDINLLPYFGHETEYSHCLKGFLIVLLMVNYFSDTHFIMIVECGFLDKLFLLCSGLVLIHFFTFLLNVMYSTLMFIFFICGDLMKERNQNLYKLFERKRENFVINTI